MESFCKAFVIKKIEREEENVTINSSKRKSLSRAFFFQVFVD